MKKHTETMDINPVVTHIIRKTGLFLDSIDSNKGIYWFCTFGGTRYFGVNFDNRVVETFSKKGTRRFTFTNDIGELYEGIKSYSEVKKSIVEQVAYSIL